MILSCHNIKKVFGDQIILKSGSFHIKQREKVALIGVNGAGKSTILKMLVHELEADSGEIILAKNKTIGYLSQHQDLSSNHTIMEELKSAKSNLIELEKQIRTMELEMKYFDGEELENRLHSYHILTQRFEQENGYAFQSELVGILKGLGFSEDEFTKEISTLSGGQKTRVALGKLLLTNPDLLLLDEPTNHLDMNSIAWLETYLMNYNGAALIVSHDRYFLNRVVSKVIEIENGELLMFEGNYSAFAEKKKMLREAKIKAYLNQQQEIKHQEAVIEKLRSFNREKSIKRAESREKALDKLERIEKPIDSQPELHFQLEPSCISGNDVLFVENLSKSFGSQTLFTDACFEVKRGEHIAIIGDNGTGKTTLLKILNEIVPADNGFFRLGSKVKIGYYDQEHQVLHMNKSVFDEISDAYPNMTHTQIRNTLAAFLFTGDDVYKLIGDLSGGERGRVSLAKLMLSEANFLIMDEPTNHLDIASKEILEKALNDYTGTVLYVSHDRYFINQTASRILDLVNYTFVNYIGNYDYYVEKKEALTAAYAPSTQSTDVSEPTVSETKLDWKAQKEAQAKKRKRQNDLNKIENKIASLESRDAEIDSLLSDPSVYSNSVKCQELSLEKASISKELESLYEEWELLAE